MKAASYFETSLTTCLKEWRILWRCDFRQLPSGLYIVSEEHAVSIFKGGEEGNEVNDYVGRWEMEPILSVPLTMSEQKSNSVLPSVNGRTKDVL